MIPFGESAAIVGGRRVERQDDRTDPRLADPAGDELRVLGAEVEDDDGVGAVGRHAPSIGGPSSALAGRGGAGEPPKRARGIAATSDARSPAATAPKGGRATKSGRHVHASRQLAAVRHLVKRGAGPRRDGERSPREGPAALRRDRRPGASGDRSGRPPERRGRAEPQLREEEKESDDEVRSEEEDDRRQRETGGRGFGGPGRALRP